MKLATVKTTSGEHYGLLLGPRGTDFVCLESAFRGLAQERGLASASERFGNSVLGFIEHVADARPAADEIVQRHAEGKLPAGTVMLDSAKVQFLSPIPRPPSMRDGYAFRQHVLTARRNRGLEMIPEFDMFPVFYFTNHGAVCGAGDLPVRKLHLDKLDFELEAAIVVGKKVRDLTPTGADSAIFGLTIMNDWSARTLQMEEMKLSLGPAKGKDFATGLGPVLVTLDELMPKATKTDKGLVFDLEMRAFVNGKQLSTGNVNQMNWTFSQIMERASYGVDLVPGDVIGSGTCGTGCLLELNGSKITDNQWLQPGDHVALEIDGIGRLENTVVLAEPA
jgi:fumarylacetoacetate (FAA) hydrolase